MKFDQRPCTIITHDLLPDSGAILKIHKKFDFDQNQLKISIQHTYRKKYKSGEFSPFHFWQNLFKDLVL